MTMRSLSGVPTPAAPATPTRHVASSPLRTIRCAVPCLTRPSPPPCFIPAPFFLLLPLPAAHDAHPSTAHARDSLAIAPHVDAPRYVGTPQGQHTAGATHRTAYPAHGPPHAERERMGGGISGSRRERAANLNARARMMQPRRVRRARCDARRNAYGQVIFEQ